FWRHIFEPLPLTWPRVLALWVPSRRSARMRSTAWCMSGTLTGTLNTSSLSVMVSTCCPARSRTTMSGIVPSLLPGLHGLPDYYDAILGAGHTALDQHQVTLREHIDHLEVQHRTALVPHLPGHACALEHLSRCRGGAD